MPDRVKPHSLSKRERQVMDVLFRRGQATAVELMTEIPDPPTNPAVRSILRILMKKRLVTRRSDGSRYVYQPAVDAARARDSALRHLIHTFFDGSVEQVVAAALGVSDGTLTAEEIARLQGHIKQARKRPKGKRKR